MIVSGVSLGIAAYLLGAIPFSLLCSKAKGVDLATVGSGNFGATNVYRALGLKVAATVFFLDAAKAAIPTAIALHYFENPYMHIVIGAMAIVGHSLSIFVKFKGGKGVAPSMGVLFALAPEVTAIIFVLGFSAISIFRYVAPVSIIGSISFPILLALLDYPVEYVTVVGLLSLFIIWRHKSNISRLLKGKENKV